MKCTVKRLLLAFLLFACFGMVFFTSNIREAKASATAIYMYERYGTGDTIAAEVYADLWEAQTFTIGATGLNTDFNVTQITLKVYRFGNAKDFIYSIRAVDAANKPTGADLCNGTSNATAWSTSATWINFTFTSEYRLKASTTYAIVMRSPESTFGDMPFVRYDTSPSSYPGGGDLVSWNSGGNWEHASNDFVFLVWGYAAQYTFHGLLDESTGLLKAGSERAVNVTAYFSGGVNSEIFTVNGTCSKNFSYIPLYFHYELGTYDREYWLTPSEYYGVLCIFNGTLTSYTVVFLDLAGILNEYPFVEAKRYVNGTLMTVEKRKVDVENKVQFSLVQGCSYTLIISDGETHTFGDLLFTSVTSISLTLRGISFPKETLLTSKYVRIYGDRALGNPNGNITITYQDTLNQTNSVAISINYKNGTNAYNATETSDSFAHTWASALNDTDYAVVCAINHQRYGAYQWKQYFPRSFSEAPWGLDWMGKLPFDTSILLPAFLILCAFGCFSVLNAYIGAFAGTVTAMLLSYMGWINIPAATLVVAVVFSVLIGLGMLKRRVET